MRYEVVGLHATRQIYQQLFRRSQTRSDFLRESAVDFFQIIHDSLSNDIEIALSRLGDPASTRLNKEDKPNATLRRQFFQLRVHRAYGDEFRRLFSQVLGYLDSRFQSITPWGNWGDGGKTPQPKLRI